MVNIECENLEVQPAELERELEYCLRKGECTGQTLEYCTRKVEWRKCKTQMSNNKCRIKCKKLNIKCNLEFWRGWNAISFTPYLFILVTCHNRSDMFCIANIQSSTKVLARLPTFAVAVREIY